MIRLLLFPLLALILVGIGCTATSADLDQTEPVETGSEGENEAMSLETPSNSDPAETGAPMSMAETERLLKAELAAKLGVPVEQIETRETEARTWLDQRLGCGDRRIVMESLPVAGYRVVLAHENQAFEYHADQEGNFKLCPDAGDIGKPLDPIK